MLYIIITSVISIIVAMLALQNGTATPLNFVIWQFEIPLICVILGSFLAGSLVAGSVLLYTKVCHSIKDFKNNREISRLNKQVDDLQKNLALLAEPVQTVNVKATAAQVKSKAEEAKVQEAPKVQETPKAEVKPVESDVEDHNEEAII